jgi:hypothetical protein
MRKHEGEVEKGKKMKEKEQNESNRKVEEEI